MCWISCRIKEIDRKQVLKRGRNPTPDTTVPSTLLNAKEKINLALPPRLNAHAPSSPESPTPSYTSQKSSCESVLLLAPILSPHLVQEGHLLTIPAYFPSLTTQIYLQRHPQPLRPRPQCQPPTSTATTPPSYARTPGAPSRTQPLT